LCEDDTTSESQSSDSDGENSYVEKSFEVLFVPEEDIQRKLSMRAPMRRGSRGWGGLTLILSVGEGRLKLIFA